MNRVCLVFLLLLNGFITQAQGRHKLAIFAPLFLDSAFDATGNFKYEKTGARFASPGLDFYFGAQLALDSLEKRGAQLDVSILDLKSNKGFAQEFQQQMDGVELLIAQSNVPETRWLADQAFKRKIPLISASLPNDAGVKNNPYMVLLNTTLQSHVEAIYHFLQKYHQLDRIIIFRRNGSQEDLIRTYFNETGRSTAAVPLNIKYVDIPAGATSTFLSAQLDSNRKNIIIAGSLDENFGQSLAQGLSGLTSTYPIRLIGMPTWDNMNFNKTPQLEIIYTNPFYYNRTSVLETQLASIYNTRMSAKPSDYFFRGYESVMRFALLLLDTGKDISSNLSRKGNTVFTQFDIQPVFKDRTTMNLDYFENKHVYFIRALGGMSNLVY